MSRYVNVRGREGRKPRGKDRMWDEIAMAWRLYHETGGNDIDFGIQSAREMLEEYRAQRQGGPTHGQKAITSAEANRARAQLTNLTRQREQKLAKCRADIDEMLETDGKANPEPDADQTEPKPAAEAEPKPAAESQLRLVPERKSVATHAADAPPPIAAASD